MPNSHLFDADIIIVGGGIIGASTAMQLKQLHPKYSVLLLEKEPHLAQHQTSHNSGVIHAGVYYQPGSLKAQFCKQGAFDMIKFCNQHKIHYQNCGKLIVATNNTELAALDDLAKRCVENSIDYRYLNQQQLKQKEPNCEGSAALFIPSTSIVDYQKVTQQMMENFVEWGGEYWLDCQIYDIKESAEHVELTTSQGQFKSKYLLCCGGLMADKLAQMADINTDFQIIPFRGEYYQLANHHNSIVKHLIYPVPNPDLPFLGIHLTKMIDGSVTVGPNAVLGFKREGYGKFNFSLKDCKTMFAFKGFWRLISRYFKSGLIEMKNAHFKSSYLKQVQRYCPTIKKPDLKPYPAGIRAQAVNSQGELIHDFLFAESERTLHVCNAPSPAATSSLPIGRYIINILNKKIS